MAAVTAAVAGAAYAANRQARAGRDAARATRQGNDAAISEQRRQYDLARSDNAPFLQAGTDALRLQQDYLRGDRSGFENSSDYLFAVDQGFKGLDRGAAAAGNLLSGGTDADRIAYGQGLASQYAGAYYNRLAGLSGTGQTAGANLAALGANSANQIGALQQSTGNARASAYQNAGNAYAGAANQLAGIGGFVAGQYGGRRTPTTTADPYGGTYTTTSSGNGWRNAYGRGGG